MRFEDTILMKMPVPEQRYPVRRELFGVQLRWARPRVSRAALSAARAPR